MFSFFSPFQQLSWKNSLWKKPIDETLNNKNQKNSIMMEMDDTNKPSSLFVVNEEKEDSDSEEEDDKEKEEEEEEDKEEEEEEIPKKREEDASIVIKGIPFYYLDNSTDINRDMDIKSYLKAQNITKIEVHIGIYKINKTNYAPFLTYGLVENNKLLSFPHFTYEVMEEEENKDESCLEECKLQILSLFNIYPDSNVRKINDFFNNKMVYNGYIDNNPNNLEELLIVFEYKEEEDKKDKLKWATIHEIVNTKTIIHQQIPILYKWFLKIPDLIYMTDIYDTIIDIPFVLYSLDKSDSDSDLKEEFHSISKTKSKENSSILPPFIFYPKFGMKYFFSNNYIDNNNTPDTPNTDRYVVFLTKTLYILDDENESKETISKYNSIYFQQNGEPIWAVSSVDFFSRL
jgi:hypothetical protein